MTTRKEEARRRFLPALLRHVSFDGWSTRALKHVAKDLGEDFEVVRQAFPGGAMGMVGAFIRVADEDMVRHSPNRISKASRFGSVSRLPFGYELKRQRPIGKRCAGLWPCMPCRSTHHTPFAASMRLLTRYGLVFGTRRPILTSIQSVHCLQACIRRRCSIGWVISQMSLRTPGLSSIAASRMSCAFKRRRGGLKAWRIGSASSSAVVPGFLLGAAVQA